MPPATPESHERAARRAARRRGGASKAEPSQKPDQGTVIQRLDVTKDLISSVGARYPQDSPAYRKKLSGSVELEARVNIDGTVLSVEVVKSLDPDLDREAKKAAMQHLYKNFRGTGPIERFAKIIKTFKRLESSSGPQ